MSSPTSSDASSRRPRASLVWGAGSLLVVVLVAATPAASVVQAAASWVPPCPFKELTGLPCPLCGTTRAAVALAHRDVGGALARYPLPALAWLGLTAAGLVAGVHALLGRRPPWPGSGETPERWPAAAWWALAAAVGLNWIYSVVTGV